MTNKEFISKLSKEETIEYFRGYCDNCCHMKSCFECYDEWLKQEHEESKNTVIIIEINQNQNSMVKIPYVLSDIQETLDVMFEEYHGNCQYKITIK